MHVKQQIIQNTNFTTDFSQQYQLHQNNLAEQSLNLALTMSNTHFTWL